MKKTLSILMSILIVYAMIFSMHFMAENSQHKCQCHSECPICQMVEVAHEIANKIAIITIGICVIFAAFFKDEVDEFSTTILNNGSILILNKVRLDN